MAEKMNVRRIGIFSGTFDPVHDGHIAFATNSIRACSLDTVFFLPEKNPRIKTGVAPIKQRVAQLEAAVAEQQNLSVLTLPHPQFSVQETLPELRTLFKDAQLTLLIGSDVVIGSLAMWPNIDELLSEMTFAFGLRKNDTADDMDNVRKQIQEMTGKLVCATYVETDFAHLSSSQLR